jgi:rare lipoprotein A
MKRRAYLRHEHRLPSLFFAIILSVIALLNGCSTVSKDGPPRYDIDVSKIPNAQPKVEQLSKYGNMPVYHVNGKNYYVMNNSKHYEAEGVASWYGTKFHKRNTSSGEKYDMLGMTAAHRTLPLPTYLEVTNKSNGRTVIVKVNDRGPFADNRILDLSYAAAKKLGMIGHGTADVKIKAIDPVEFAHNKPQWTAPTEPTQFAETHNAFKEKQLAHASKTTHLASSAPSPKTTSHVYLQVGAFSNKSYAQKLKKHLSSIVASSVQITERSGTKKLYRVQIGPIKDKTTVSQINKQLKSIGLNGKILFV